MPLVSVVMPVYNRETMVGDAIRSIQNQTFEDWELLVLDDASTDQTLEVCRALEAEDHRIHVDVNERNVGCGQSRNRLVAQSAGDYIAIQDSDDVSIPNRLALEVEILQSKADIGIVSGIAEWVDIDRGKVLSKYPPFLKKGGQYPQDQSEMIRLLMIGCEVAVTTCMFRRSVLDGIAEPFGNYRFVDDWYFFLRSAERTFMWGIPEVLVKMGRGKNHAHLWKDYIHASREAKKMKRDIYEYYKADPNLPLTYWNYRRSVAILLTLQGKDLGGWKGYLSVLQSLLWDPFYRNAYKSLGELTKRTLREGKRLVAHAIEGD